MTGGSRGLGRAMCERFLKSGAKVVALARRPDAMEQTIAEIRESCGLTLEGVCADVSNEIQLRQAFAEIADRHGGVDILVNNAASSMRRPLAELKAEEFQGDIDQKVTAVIRLSQLVLPHMQQQRWGRIINMVSIFGKAPQAASAPTSVSRAAGIALTKAMSLELAKDNITVNALCIGYIESDQWRRKYDATPNAGSYAEYLAEQGKVVPLGRIGRPQEIGDLACFIASERASYITGTAINVDGGMAPVV